MLCPNPSEKISPHFTWHDALWLPQWSRHASVSDGLTDDILENLIGTFRKMEAIRAAFDAKIIVHESYRPVAYNSLPSVGGAPQSAHLSGLAVDFHVDSLDCDLARKFILDHALLDTLSLRMEDRPKSDWVHLDRKELSPGHKRFFIP